MKSATAVEKNVPVHTYTLLFDGEFTQLLLIIVYLPMDKKFILV